MKKIIKLTESDLTRIVKRVLKESSTEERDYDYINEDKNIELLNSISKSVEELHNKINDLDIYNDDRRHLNDDIKLIKTILQNINIDDNFIRDCEEIKEILYYILRYTSHLKNTYVINSEQFVGLDEIIFDDIIDKLNQITIKSSNEKVDLIDEVEKSLTPLLKQLDLEISKRGDEYTPWIGYGDKLLDKINDIKEGEHTNFEVSNWLGKISTHFIGLSRYPRSKNDVELVNLIDDILKIIF
jgi:hypothetical protein